MLALFEHAKAICTLHGPLKMPQPSVSLLIAFGEAASVVCDLAIALH